MKQQQVFFQEEKKMNITSADDAIQNRKRKISQVNPVSQLGLMNITEADFEGVRRYGTYTRML